MKCVPAVILLAVVLTLNRLAYMSKALSRYVAFLRAVNGGQVNTILKEDLRSLFTESGAGWAETYIGSGNVVFECLSGKVVGILERAHDRLRVRHKIEQPIIVRTMAELTVLYEAGIPPIVRPNYIGVMATFLSTSTQAKTVPGLPLTSRRGDICVFEMRKDVVLSHRFKVNGNAGDANALAERLFGVPSTSRSWETVQGLVRKFSVSPTTRGNG
ncbi:MAG TPA: DUF1697 domain-containing protein [Chthoniobacterales bacterium]|nr:DUF1697 domain-containing protein [Chthoniobacterales bacterium]